MGRRGHSFPVARAWPKNAFIPVPEYWIDFTLPIAFWELCNTDLASGLMSEQAVIARHATIASKSFLFMVFFKASLRRNPSTL